MDKDIIECRDCETYEWEHKARERFSGWTWVTKFSGVILYTCPDCNDKLDRLDDARG